MEYKVGDKVKIREDLIVHGAYRPTGCEDGGIHVTYGMKDMSGEIVTISLVDNYVGGGKCYHIKEDRENYWWADTMFCKTNTNSPSFNLLV